MGTYLPTFSDQFLGGAGIDRVLYLGGDKDRRGFDVSDFAALQYNTLLHRYEFSALVWDIGTQSFRTQAGPGGTTMFQQEFLYYQTRDVEQTQIELRSGNDVFHADPGFRFLPASGIFGANNFDTWGIELGDYEQGATEAALTINGGFGDDRLFGGVLADVINGGPGDDDIVGNLGDDEIQGSGGNDRLFGNLPPATIVIKSTPDSFLIPPGFPAPSPEESFVYTLAVPFLETTTPPRTGVTTQSTPNAGGVIETDSNAYGIKGSNATEQLSRIVPVGDFNDDSITDYMVSGASTSYLVFGPFNVKDLESARDLANIVIDHSAIGIPADRYGDINGDGIADLAFSLRCSTSVVVNIVFGGSTVSNPSGGRIAWPRDWDASFAASFLASSGGNSNFRTLRLPGALVTVPSSSVLHPANLSDSGSISVQIFETTGDGTDEVMVTSSSRFDSVNYSPSAGSDSDPAFTIFGYVFSGAKIAGSTVSELQISDALTAISSGTPLDFANALVNRYSFNEQSGSILVDSVGGNNATLVDRSGSGTTSGGGGNIRSAGSIRLFGGSDATADYLALPDNLLVGLTSATFEIWGQRNSVQNWGRMFDFGPSGSEYFMSAWNLGITDQGRSEWVDQAGASRFDGDFGIFNNIPTRFVFVISQGAGSGGQTLVTIYRNKQFVGSFETPNTLAQLSPGSNWLGRSKFSDDSVADATYEEFRLYNRALSISEINRAYDAGPDANFNATVPAVVVGDLNGDGRDEVVFGSLGAKLTFTSAEGQNHSSDFPILSGLPERAASQFTFSDVLLNLGSESVRPYALGNLNNDGFDEFAIGRARELQIYNGRTDLTSAMTPSLIIAGMDLSATGGDFDGNGIGDIAVTGRPIMTSPRSVAPQTYIYSDVASRTIGTTLTLSNADKVIAATGIDRFVPGLTFDASGNDLALLPVSAINRLNSFSMSFWFRTTRVESQVFVSGIRLADGSTQTSAFRIAQFGPNSIQVVMNGVSNIFSMPNYLDGEYHHFTFARSISESTIRVYLDGAIVATWLSVPTAALQPIDVSGGYFAIGNFISDSVFTTNPSLRFEGDMSDFSIWNRSLAQSDVRRINDGLISGSETGLVARYKLDEVSGTDLVDSTGINAKGLLGKPNAANSQPSRTSIFVPNRSLPIQPNLDVNADGVSDLLVSASSGAGRISFITGARLPRPIPSSFDVLENWSVAGSGSFVKDSGTGQPTRFNLGGKPYVFSAGSSERWFQFATVGDGKAENLIRLNGPVRMDLLDSKGSVLLTNQTALSMRTMAAGTY